MIEIIKGNLEAIEGEKRTYIPGFVLKSTCPKCGRESTQNLGDQYLSYPKINGGPVRVDFYCCHYDSEIEAETGCMNEWQEQVKLVLSVEPVD